MKHIEQFKREAFTLAEILITLGIIGIVAALTIPNLMSNYRAKKLQTQLQRANAIIQQAGLRMKADEINLDEVVNKRDYQTFQSYFKDGGCELPKQAAYNVYRTYSNTNAAKASASRLIQPFCLADGQILWIGELYNLVDTTTWTKDTNNAMLAIDINGWKNKPNRYGHDVFFWAYDPKAQMLVPMGESKVYFSVSPSIYYKQCPGHESWGEQGIGCTYKALNDKSYFSNLPK